MQFAIIGYGKMGKLYDKLLNAEFIVDLFPVANKIFFSNLDEFLYYRPQVDLVIVTTPTRTHSSIVKDLLINNYNVLCEKPICLFADECKELEKLALARKVTFFQSCLERFNPVIKFLKNKLDFKKVNKVISYRFGPESLNNGDIPPKYDLGIHDIDLHFHLFKGQVKWDLHTGYGDKRREITFYLTDNSLIIADLLNKKVKIGHEIFDLTFETSNPILEMIDFIKTNKAKINEKWSKEINILQFNTDKIIKLVPHMK